MFCYSQDKNTHASRSNYTKSACSSGRDEHLLQSIAKASTTGSRAEHPYWTPSTSPINNTDGGIHAHEMGLKLLHLQPPSILPKKELKQGLILPLDSGKWMLGTSSKAHILSSTPDRSTIIVELTTMVNGERTKEEMMYHLSAFDKE